MTHPSIWNENDYTDFKLSGSGTFGVVWSVTKNKDQVTEKKFAIKKLREPFQSSISAKRVYREIRLLKHVAHENVIKLLHLKKDSESVQNLKEIYLVTELMDCDLSHVIENSDNLEYERITDIIYQILRGLKYLHSSNIIHRDLKPSNITINRQLVVKIIDFGLARSEIAEMTAGVVTLWYRAPELLLNCNYTKSIDLWSVGCILYELFYETPLFKGVNHIDQIQKTLEIVGFSLEDCNLVLKPEAIDHLKAFGNFPRVNFFEKFSFIIRDRNAIDLMNSLLVVDPIKRLTAEQALKHDYVKELHDPENEPTGTHFDNSFEESEYTIEEWKEKIFDEIQNFDQSQFNDE